MIVEQFKDYAHVEFEYNEKLERENYELRDKVDKLYRLLKSTVCCSDFRMLGCDDCPYNKSGEIPKLDCILSFEKELKEELNYYDETNV